MQNRPAKWPAIVSIIAIVFGVMVVTALGIFVLAARFAVQSNSLDHDSHEQSSPTGNAAESQTRVGDTVEAYFAQPLTWHACQEEMILGTSGKFLQTSVDDYQCATLKAPLDWSNAKGDFITLNVARYKPVAQGGQAGESREPLFFNLGGPGAAAVSNLVSQVETSLGDDLLASYDIVALDPRGVGGSTPVVCMTDRERDERNSGVGETSNVEKSTEQIVEEARKDMEEYAKGCQELSGDIFRHVDTKSAVIDFEMVRSLLKAEKFNYLGYSYGTFLGATYADTYPERVGRMVLDGALDPAASLNDVADMQMRGFEASLRHWVEDCLTGATCPLTGDVDSGMKQIRAFLDRLERAPMETSDKDRPLTRELAQTAIIGLLYSTDTAGLLSQAFTQALREEDGSVFLFLADLLNERQEDGTYPTFGTDALNAINSLDFSPVGTPEEWAAAAKRLNEELIVFGSSAGWASAGLDAWPTNHAERRAVNAKGAAPIVVVGTTNDPATPYVMSQALAQQLESGVLVTWEGWNHTAYSKDGSACVRDAVESYLVGGKVPTDGLTCRD